MRISSVLLAISLSPLAGVPAFARDVTAPPPIVLAQADEGCPEGQNCSKKQKGEKQRKRSDAQQQEQAPQQQEAKPKKQQRQERPKASAHQQQQDQPAASEQPAKKRPPKQAKQAQDQQQADQPSRKRPPKQTKQTQDQQQQAAPAEEPKAKQSSSGGNSGDKARRRAAAKQHEKPAEEQAPAAANTEQPPAAADQGNEDQPQGGAKKRDRRRATGQQQEQPAEEEAPAATAEQPSATPEGDQGKSGAGGKNRERRRAGSQQQETPSGEAAAPQEPAAADQSTEEQPAAGEGNPRDRAVNKARQRQQQLKQREQAGQAGEAESAGGAEAAAAGASTTEQQLEAQGDRQDADRVRELRQKAREGRRAASAAADQEDGDQTRQADRRRDEDQTGFVLRRDRDRREEVVERRGDRVIIREGDRVYVRPIVPDEGERLLYRAHDVGVEHLGGGRTRTVVYREGGAQVITVRDRYGDVIRRVKRYPDGREIILIGNRPRDEIGAPPVIFLPNQLPPIVVRIPRDRYIVDYAEAPVEVIQEALLAPPVEPIERPYSLEEVTRNERLREKMSRIDLDTINFEFGSATIEPGEMQTLDRIGQAMQAVLSEHPDEVYLIEGHTDLVGSDSDNLVLSDERAESIAVALSQNYDIPPENLVTEGYGEQYPKVDTEGPERENRRVTVRRITPLLAKGDDQAQDDQDDQSSQTP
jgi:outer membrane protein OmpA-like peptidoglycan-associated protein